MLKNVQMDLEFLPYLSQPPLDSNQLQTRAVSNDQSTINNWADTWLANAKVNRETYGSFAEKHVGQFFGRLKMKPCIVLGSGPSLENSIKALKNNKNIYVISCLHNFHYLMDNDIKVDLWVTLDAGKVTLEEISEGGKRPHQEYLELSKDQKLAAFISTDPDLLESWQGEKYWYSCGIPDENIRKKLNEIEKFEIFVSSGGCVFGAGMYIAKAFMGAEPIAVGGADFCFSYDKRFHPWKSKYDGKLGRPVIANDIFGNKVYTWPSYQNFKYWFESVAIRCPGTFFNASEGGTLGAYRDGLSPAWRQITMHDFIRRYEIYKEMQFMAENPSSATEPGFKLPKILF